MITSREKMHDDNNNDIETGKVFPLTGIGFPLNLILIAILCIHFTLSY